MKKLSIFLYLLLQITIVSSYANYINVSSCQTINSSLLGGADEVRINESFSHSGSCFNVVESNVKIDCMHNTISGDGSGTFLYSGTNNNNVSFVNCNVNNFFYGIDFSLFNVYNDDLYFENLTFSNFTSYYVINLEYFSNLTLNNISLLNISDGINLLGWEVNSRSILSNIYIENSSSNIDCRFGIKSTICVESTPRVIAENITIFQDDSQYSLMLAFAGGSAFNNITINNTQNGMYLGDTLFNNFSQITINVPQNSLNIDSSSDNIFDNIVLSNLNNSIIFEGSDISGKSEDNIFRNSYLGNYSSIISSNWSLATPNTFENNNYFGGSVSSTCFDNPLNQSCEVAVISSSTTSSLFPLGSIIISIILTLGYFII
ncbi:MAG: hypothetical protein VXZ40_03030 [Nanoarchaeota archaeon]|nr:hypothetical protein [Nanoarchaeota archaeon]